ncbi:peptidase, M28 family [Formosa agariphila KMM 3901]|uniref:Carboxypeptidase Q n=1 Tax=Formosa agariphila (strain DSM 15362 / KCTC 12365 / LMG 23005 / KMM 3901 / M-2Alg 35-1) TaxID=1347342 RepID=T2KJ33_FORAG|nr:M28 family peptidase [Formosa agariphila]CDF78448.1 peptidase, M28 family [Formosa agariphila KMM 3901]
MKNIIILIALCLGSHIFAQSDEDILKQIYKSALVEGKSYSWLETLSIDIGGRLSGSLNAERAVEWGKAELDSLGLDKVWLQPVMVPKWVRGAKEFAYIKASSGETTNVNICALGGSVSTNPLGLTAKVIEVKDFEELKRLGEAEVKGKIVFYNRPMQPDLINTFEAYGGCVDQRYMGAVEAAKYGAAGVIVRSMTLSLDDMPHAGSMTYGDLQVSDRIPSAAISTKDANLLSSMLHLDKNLEFYFKQNCKQLKDVKSYNVIGEITGSQFPNDYIIVGGHLDSWDLGDGSHDDGAGIVQSMEVLRLFKTLKIKPKHSIRVVMFMNEENGLRGATEYAKVATTNGENHIMSLESDSGGFTPRGFSFDCSDATFNKVLSWKPLFKPYLIHYFEKGGSGADVGPLKNDTNVTAGLRPDSQRYFDHHHSASDTFDAVNKRELELGAASMASLVYLFDKHGI